MYFGETIFYFTVHNAKSGLMNWKIVKKTYKQVHE